MITYNFDRIFKARAIERPFTFLRKAGFSDNFATKIKNNKVLRLNLIEIERLCIVLRCTPNDFYIWEPDNDNNVDKEHPINLIKKSDKAINLSKILNSIPLGQLDEIEKLINQEIMKAKVLNTLN